MAKEVVQITPIKLLEELEYIKKDIDTVHGKRLLVLIFHLYLEYFVNKIYDNKIKEFSKEQINVESIKKGGLKTKATCLVVWKVIDKIYFDPISVVNDLRGELVHTLDPKIVKIEAGINKIIPDMADRSGLIAKFLEKSNPWEKLQAYIIPTIYYLYGVFLRVEGKENDYSAKFEINPNTSSLKIKFQALKLFEELKDENLRRDSKEWEI